MRKYLIRLDDACPTMDRDKWQRMEALLTKYCIRPMVGVIPENADQNLMVSSNDELFWDKVARWEKIGWTIALHGFDHCYITSDSGINPLWKRSEFAGTSLEVQVQKVRRGVEIFQSHGIFPRFFFAPSHTFDENTLKALLAASDIRIISDTVATRPYRKGEFVFVPQFGGYCRNMPIPGIYTFCYHPNEMTDEDFAKLDMFLEKRHSDFTSFDSLDLKNVGPMTIWDKMISWIYFMHRKLKGIL